MMTCIDAHLSRTLAFWVDALQRTDLDLKRMGLLDPNVSRLITKLLVKNPEERWTASKCMHSSFFKARDDTTRMANSSHELGQTVRNMAGVSFVHSISLRVPITNSIGVTE